MGGGFLKKNKDGQWYDVGDNGAREKTSQALRQRAPEMRKILFENEQRQVQAAMLMQQQQQMAAMQAAAANGGVMPANMMAVPAPGGMQMVQVNPAATMVNAQMKQPATTEQKKKEDEGQTIEDMANDTASIASCMMSNVEVDFEDDDDEAVQKKEEEEEVKAPAKVEQVAV